MNDFVEPAPAEPTPIAETPTEETQQETPSNEAATETPKEKPSRRSSLEKAFAKLDKEEGETGADEAVKSEVKQKDSQKPPSETKKASETKADTAKEKPADKPEAAKDAKTAEGYDKPPQRLSEAAKKEWANAPEAVRAEVSRAIQETEKGIQKYQQAIEPIQPFLDMAKGDPKRLATAMGRYVNTENMLKRDPVAGFTEIARNMGLSPQQVGKMLMGQDAGQADPRDRQMMAMAQELQALRQQTGQVTQTMQQQREQAVLSQVEQFAAQNPRFDELSEEIATMLSSGYAQDLQDAYNKADRLNPAPAPAVEASPNALSAQTRTARSVTGAPTSGSNPAHRKPSSSRREALERGFNRAGL